MPFADLREFLNYLEDRGQLQRIQEEVDPKYELAARLGQATMAGGPALLFERVRGTDIPVVGGVLGTRERMLMAVEATRENINERLIQGMTDPVLPQLVASGPCQEVVLLGEEVDLGQLPTPTFSPKDAGPYITVGLAFSKDPETGTRNLSIMRIQVTGSRRLGIQVQSYHDAGVQLAKAEALGRSLEIAIVIGSDPVIPLASQWRAPYGVDELGLVGALRGQPVELVKCRTIDMEVPARAEIVIEGRIPPGVREMEGPFGEMGGYYTPASPKPMVEVTAITRRHHPIYQTVLPGPSPTEHYLLYQSMNEVDFYQRLRGLFPGVKAVHCPTMGTTFVSLRQTGPQQARSLLTALLSEHRTKIAVVVDDDIDVFDVSRVLWAVSTRSQPDRDVILLPEMIYTTLDPSSNKGVSAKMGIDATRPFGQPFPEVVAIPGVS